MGLNLSQPAVPVCPHPSCEKVFFISSIVFPPRLVSARPPAHLPNGMRSSGPKPLAPHAALPENRDGLLACCRGAGPLDSSKQQLLMMMMPAGGRPDVTADRWPHHGHLLRLDKLLVVTCAVFQNGSCSNLGSFFANPEIFRFGGLGCPRLFCLFVPASRRRNGEGESITNFPSPSGHFHFSSSVVVVVVVVKQRRTRLKSCMRTIFLSGPGLGWAVANVVSWRAHARGDAGGMQPILFTSSSEWSIRIGLCRGGWLVGEIQAGLPARPGIPSVLLLIVF